MKDYSKYFMSQSEAETMNMKILAGPYSLIAEWPLLDKVIADMERAKARFAVVPNGRKNITGYYSSVVVWRVMPTNRTGCDHGKRKKA